MGLFGKKKEEAGPCCCGGDCSPQRMAQAEVRKYAPGVRVLGSGCARCKALGAAAEEALAELGMDTTVGHVTDFAEIASYGVMTTPALVIDGRVVSCGRVLRKEEIAALLKKVRGTASLQP